MRSSTLKLPERSFCWSERMEQVSSITGNGAGREVFAMTDEQILEMEPLEEVASGQDAATMPRSLDSGLQNAQTSARADRNTPADGAKESTREGRTPEGKFGGGVREGLTPEGVSYREGTAAQEPPRWLAERMRDPWHGDEAKELWEGAVQAREEAA